MGYRIKETTKLRFDKKTLKKHGISGLDVPQIRDNGFIFKDNKKLLLDEVSFMKEGDAFAYVPDTRYCDNAVALAQKAKMLLCEATYLSCHESVS